MKRTLDKTNGYIVISPGNGKTIREHRWVMSQAIGRPLRKDEIVHHVNHNKNDNRLENLQIMTHKEHQAHHAKRRQPTIKPMPLNIGETWIDVKNDYKVFVVSKCGDCKKLFWRRTDYPAIYCSPICSRKPLRKRK